MSYSYNRTAASSEKRDIDKVVNKIKKVLHTYGAAETLLHDAQKALESFSFVHGVHGSGVPEPGSGRSWHPQGPIIEKALASLREAAGLHNKTYETVFAAFKAARDEYKPED